ncbi:MAG: peptide ABC transporter permease [Halobacteriovoraceae bacterium]|nr:peptide ABC transporter permease [Halobacteriovoraceae bacterium]
MASGSSNSLWQHALKTLIKDKLAVTSLIIVLFYSLLAVLSATGLIASGWSEEVGPSYAPPSADYLFGLDIFGRSVLAKTIKGTEIAMSVGLVTGMISMVIGVFLGAIAGYYGGKVDEFIVWFYTTFTSIPTFMLLVSITFILGKGILAVYLALGLTTWVSLCRLIRGEFIRHKDRDYVQAASAIGGGDFRKIFKHILPNVFHIVIINFSLQFQVAIKSEVILSYLGLGVQGKPSWGIMINDAKLELARGNWWQLAAATVAMMIVVLAFNILGDALRDALDPKLKGK